MTYRLGVNTGGTFTDFILVDEEDWSYRVHKTPSTPEEPAASFANGLRELADLLGFDTPDLVGRTTLIVHGTTVATNAVLTRGGECRCGHDRRFPGRVTDAARDARGGAEQQACRA